MLGLESFLFRHWLGTLSWRGPATTTRVDRGLIWAVPFDPMECKPQLPTQSRCLSMAEWPELLSLQAAYP